MTYRFAHCIAHEFRSDGYVALPVSEVNRLQENGDAIIASEDAIIPQYHAYGYRELEHIIGDYQSLAALLDAKLFIRGQRRAYFKDDNSLLVLPAAFRSNAEGTIFNSVTTMQSIREQLFPWQVVLKETSDIEIGDCLRFVCIEPGAGFLRFFEPSVWTGRVSSLTLESILQHYGFPTRVLDVTTSLPVATWFALHEAAVDHSGVIQFLPYISQPRNCGSGIDDIPILILYIQSTNNHDWPVIHLASCEELARVAIRPIVQEAYALPWHRVDASQPHDGILFTEQPICRCPVAVIRLHFDTTAEVPQRHSSINQEYLLPTNDPLYTQLYDAGVPKLANIGVPNRRMSFMLSGVNRENKVNSLCDQPLRDARPGSIAAKNPRVTDVWRKSGEAFRNAGVVIRAATLDPRYIIFVVDDGTIIARELEDIIHEICEWGNVEYDILEKSQFDSENDW